MNRDYEEFQDKKLIKVIIGLVVICVVTPFILEWGVFRSDIYSVISNGDWASFLGSFLGGIIGGIGTLIAVYFTTNQTRKIQEKNEETLEHEIKLRERKERKEFTDEIATLVSRYIAELKRHDRNLSYVSEINKDITELQVELKNQIDFNLVNALDKSIDAIDNQIDRKEKEKRSIELDRIIADECFNLLIIKLNNIDKAKGIIKHLNCTNKCILLTGDELDMLRNVTNNFINEYIDYDNN